MGKQGTFTKDKSSTPELVVTPVVGPSDQNPEEERQASKQVPLKVPSKPKRIPSPPLPNRPFVKNLHV
jgi:hypothetical protein